MNRYLGFRPARGQSAFSVAIPDAAGGEGEASFRLSRQRSRNHQTGRSVEIGAILEMSPRTVEKHFEHIFEKLGVETRTAAVMRLLAGSLQRSNA